jgi:hypothetical protein
MFSFFCGLFCFLLWLILLPALMVELEFLSSSNWLIQKRTPRLSHVQK